MATEANNLRAMTPGAAANRLASENRRYVILAQLLIAAGIGWSLANTLLLVWRAASLPAWHPFGIHEANLLAFALAGGAFIYTLRNPTAQDFANDVMVELRKVTWPTWKETRQATMVVIVVVAIIASILGVFDLIWAKLIKFLLSYGASS